MYIIDTDVEKNKMKVIGININNGRKHKEFDWKQLLFMNDEKTQNNYSSNETVTTYIKRSMIKDNKNIQIKKKYEGSRIGLQKKFAKP